MPLIGLGNEEDNAISLLLLLSFSIRLWREGRDCVAGSSSNLIPEIVEAFRTKTRLAQKYPNQENGKDTIVIDQDFSSYSGEFICYMGGHSHVTTQIDVTRIRNRSTTLLPQRMLLCTNMSPSEAGTVFNRVKRTENTITDNSFCIYAIDTKERNIYITFFGAYLPSDKTTAEYPVIQVIGY